MFESTSVVEPDSTTLPSTEMPKSSGPALPLLSLVTTLVSVIDAVLSSFVMVHVMSSPSSSVMVPPRLAGHFASPVIETNVYPVSCVSLIANGVLAAYSFGTPDSTAPPSTVSIKSSGNALPPLLFVGSLTMVSFGATSSFVMVHVMSSPSSSVIVPPRLAGHFASPVIETNVYPVSCVSLIANGVLAAYSFGTPDSTAPPSTVSIKSSGNALPPLLFVGSLTMVSFGATSSFVMVHVRFSPSSSVTVSPRLAGHPVPVIDVNV